MRRFPKTGSSGPILALFALFLLFGADGFVLRAQSSSAFENQVIVVSVDGMRADLISKWGYSVLDTEDFN
jgi:LPXTG-motif cell wall-anchored protein